MTDELSPFEKEILKRLNTIDRSVKALNQRLTSVSAQSNEIRNDFLAIFAVEDADDVVEVTAIEPESGEE